MFVYYIQKLTLTHKHAKEKYVCLDHICRNTDKPVFKNTIVFFSRTATQQNDIVNLTGHKPGRTPASKLGAWTPGQPKENSLR